MAKKLKPDRILFLVTLVLVGFGVAMVFSSSAIVAKEKFGDPNYFSLKQLISATLGLAVMFVIMKVDYHIYRHPAMVFSVLAMVVALLVLTASLLVGYLVLYAFATLRLEPAELTPSTSTTRG